MLGSGEYYFRADGLSGTEMNSLEEGYEGWVPPTRGYSPEFFAAGQELRKFHPVLNPVDWAPESR